MKRATLIKMVIIFALLLVVVSIFAARTFAASASNTQNAMLTPPPVPTAPFASGKGLTPPPLPTQPPAMSRPMEPGRRHRPKPPTPTPVPTQPPVSAQPPAPTPTQPASGGGNNQQLAAQLFALINSNRTAKGLPAYTLNSTLSNGAYQHDVTMASPQCGALMHQCPGEPSPSQRVTNEGIKWMATGENIGEASYPNAWQGIQAVHQQMVNEGPSGGHYQNLFSSTYHQCGIGILIDAKGTVWITEDFTN